jgi:general secretion pathway protein N
MTRIRLPLGRGLFFLCVFLFALVALLPLRLALDWLSLNTAGFSARQAEGSIWLGAVREARIGGAPLGDLRTRLDTLPLLGGRARISFARLQSGEATPPIEGSVSVSRHSIAAADVTANLPLANAFAPLPVASLDLRDVSVRFQYGLCDHADGLVKAQVAGDVGGISLPGGLTGNARCEAGALLLPLASPGGAEMLSLAIQAGGRYRAELLIRPNDAAARTRLLASGFAPSGDRLRLSIDGTL